MQFEAGGSVGEYQLLFPLKQTEHAEVWAAKGAAGAKAPLVALKLLKGTSNDDPAVASLDEARAATALHHDGLVETFEIREQDGSVYVASALIQGPSLAALMQRLAREGRPLSAAITVYLGQKLAAALDYAASSASIDGLRVQLVHRHLSPHNVLIEPAGSVRLSDLGISSTDRAETPAGVVRGKINYMAPEQLTGGRVSPASDVFSLAVILYECGSGRSLFARDSLPQSINAVLNQAPRPLPELMPGFPEPLWQVINKALAKDPEDRYPNVGAMLAALNAIAGAVPGYAHAQEALAQFVTSLFPPDAFSARPAPPASNRSGQTGDLFVTPVGEPPRKSSLAPTSWPAVVSPDPLAANPRPQSLPARPSSTSRAPLPRPSSAAGTPSLQPSAGLGVAGIRTPSQPPAPLSFVGTSGALQEPYWTLFEPVIADPRTPKYAGMLAGALGLVWVLGALFSTSSARHEAELARLLEGADREAAVSYFVENFEGFDDPRLALSSLVGPLAVAPGEATSATPDVDAAREAPAEVAEPVEVTAPPVRELARPEPAPPLPEVSVEPPAALPSGGKKASAFVRRGQRSLENGNLNAAARAFQGCLQVQELAVCHRQLGYIYQAQDNRRLAVRHWERYVELVPKVEDAELIRQHLKRAMSTQ